MWEDMESCLWLAITHWIALRRLAEIYSWTTTIDKACWTDFVEFHKSRHVFKETKSLNPNRYGRNEESRPESSGKNKESEFESNRKKRRIWIKIANKQIKRYYYRVNDTIEVYSISSKLFLLLYLITMDVCKWWLIFFMSNEIDVKIRVLKWYYKEWND